MVDLYSGFGHVCSNGLALHLLYYESNVGFRLIYGSGYIYLTGPGESGKINPVYPAVSTRKTGLHRTGAQPCPSATCQFGLISLTMGTYGGDLGLS